MADRGHVRRRGNGWEIRAYAGHGRTITRTVHGTEKQAGRALTKLLAEIDRGDHARDETITVQGLADEWIAARRAVWSPATLNTYQAHLRRNILPLLGSTPIVDVTARQLEQLYTTIGARLGAAAVLKAHSMLVTMFGQAVRWGWLTVNPALQASAPKATTRRIEPPTVDQVRALLAVARAHDPDLAVFLHLAAATGARRGELCGLRHADLDDLTLTIERAVVNGPRGQPRIVKSTKTGRSRTLRLDTRTAELVEALWKRRLVMADECGHRLRGGYLFAYDVPCHQPWNPSGVSQRFAGLRTKAKLPGVRLHDIRHYAATVMLDAGIPLATVAERGGWANASTLLRTYAHRVQASDDNAAELLGGLLD